MLMGIALTSLLMIISMVILDLTHTIYTGRGLLYLASFFFLATAGVIALIERYVSSFAANLIFTILITIGIILGDEPRAFVEGQSIIFLVLPLVLAGLLLRPWAGYVVAALINLGEVAGFFIFHTGIPNISAMLLIVFLAWIVHQNTSGLERAVEQERKKSRALSESEEKYRRLIDLLPVGVLINQNGKIVMANPAAVKLARAKSQDELIGTTLIDHIHPDSRLMVQERTQAVLSKGINAEIVEEKLLRLDGTAFFAETTGLPLTFNDKPAILVVFTDITERKRAREAITLQNQRIKEISRKLLEVQEREKHLLAAELHDDLGQSLTSLKLMLELAGKAGSSGRQKRLAEARELVAELMNKVRNLSLDLRPAMLDDFGLFAALRWLFDRFQSRTGISVRCDSDLDRKQRFEPPVETAAFRIIQEALTNIARHASVREAQVTISTDKVLSIEIEDKGPGFIVPRVIQNAAISSGLSGMQERARLLGGSVEIISEPGSGTRVIAEIPLVETVS
jgi:PAS domain S-box-containing protein